LHMIIFVACFFMPNRCS